LAERHQTTWRGYGSFPDELFDRAVAGDQAAAAELWEWMLGLCHEMATRLCRRQGMRADLVDDVVQDAMIGLIGLGEPDWRLREVDDKLAYIYTVVANSIRTQWRRIQRRRPENVSVEQARDGSDEPWTMADLLAAPDDPVANAEVAEMEAWLEAQLDTLPKKTALVFRLHMQGLTQKEIAEQADVAFGTVGTWVHRTRHRLREALRERDQP